MGTFTPATPMWLILFCFTFIGVGMGFFLTPNSSATMGSVPEAFRGVGGAILSTMSNVGMALGEAISAALLASCMASLGFQVALGGASAFAWKGAFSFAMRVTSEVAAASAVSAGLLSLARRANRSIDGVSKQMQEASQSN